MWYITADPRLAPPLIAALRSAENEVFLSVISLWEATIKNKLGKLPLPDSPEVYLVRQRERHEISALAIDEPSVAVLATLQSFHRDPFDRMLVCQAIHHGMTIVTTDQALRNYPVALFA